MGNSFGYIVPARWHGHSGPVTSATKQNVEKIFDSLTANPKVGVQQLEGVLSELPRNDTTLAVRDESGYNLLQKCVAANNAELVRWILQRNRGHGSVDINRFVCSLPLHIACLKGHTECIDLLLKYGARIDVESRMCWPGPHTGNCEERKEIPKRNYDNDSVCLLGPFKKLQSAIYYALDGDQVNVMILISQKLKKNVMFRARKPLLHAACERKAWECTQVLVSERPEEINMLKDEYYPIHYAAFNELKFLELLINAGANTTVKTTTQQLTLLHIVIIVAHKSAENTKATIRLLLENGCKNILNEPDLLDNTPIHALIVRYALEEAQYSYNKWSKWDILGLMRYLIQAGAGQSINRPGNSAIACVLRHIKDWDVCYELLLMLLEEGGDPNEVGRDGSVPILVCLVPLINKNPLLHLTHIMKTCYLNCIRVLLKKGANPNCSYRPDLTPLHVLVFTVSENITVPCEQEKQQNFEFIKDLLILLLSYGLNPNVIIKQHILESCMDMIQNVRDCKDMKYVYELTLILLQYGANPDLLLDMSETDRIHFPIRSEWKIKNFILYYYIMLISGKENIIMDPNMLFAKIINLFYYSMQHEPLFNCLKILHTQQLSLVPDKMSEPLTAIIRDLYSKPRTLKQICRVHIYNALGRQPGLHVNKLNLPSSLESYILNFETDRTVTYPKC